MLTTIVLFPVVLLLGGAVIVELGLAFVPVQVAVLVTMGFVNATEGHWGNGEPLTSIGAKPIMPPVPYDCTGIAMEGVSWKQVRTPL